MPRGGFRGQYGEGGKTGARFDSRLTREQVLAVVARYAAGDSTVALCAEYGVAAPTVQYHLRRAGVPRRGTNGRRYRINEAAFDVLTADAAYWAGFLMADGCVRREGASWRILLGIQTRDRGHLDGFARFLGTDKPVRCAGTKGTGCWRLDVFSHRLGEKLIALGVTPRKSLTAEAAPVIESDRHFWRGVVDGDGCVRRKTDGHASVQLLGSPRITEQFALYVRATVPGSRVNAYPYGDGRRCHRVTLGGSTARALLRELYQVDDTALERKAAAARALLAVA